MACDKKFNNEGGYDPNKDKEITVTMITKKELPWEEVDDEDLGEDTEEEDWCQCKNEEDPNESIKKRVKKIPVEVEFDGANC